MYLEKIKTFPKIQQTNRELMLRHLESRGYPWQFYRPSIYAAGATSNRGIILGNSINLQSVAQEPPQIEGLSCTNQSHFRFKKSCATSNRGVILGNSIDLQSVAQEPPQINGLSLAIRSTFNLWRRANSNRWITPDNSIKIQFLARTPFKLKSNVIKKRCSKIQDCEIIELDQTVLLSSSCRKCSGLPSPESFMEWSDRLDNMRTQSRKEVTTPSISIAEK